MILQILFDTGIRQPPTATSATLWPVWVVLGLVGVAIVGIIVQRVIVALQRPDLHGLSPEKIRDTWAEIEKSLGHGLMGAKLAVIEADKLLDGVLKSLLFPGDTMGERLKTAQYKYPNIRKVWPAHKLRNQLVHDATFELTQSQARRAVSDFHDALRLLRVL